VRRELREKHGGGVIQVGLDEALSKPEMAAALGISPATVKRDWAMTKRWLYRELTRPPQDS
jgi:hypothetical protein